MALAPVQQTQYEPRDPVAPTSPTSSTPTTTAPRTTTTPTTSAPAAPAPGATTTPTAGAAPTTSSTSSLAAPTSGPAASAPAPAATNLDPLYARNPGTATVGAAAPIATSQIGSSGLLSSAQQLNNITSRDSPLMMRARQEGMLTAARRGLQNSSIAAGAAEGAMVDRASPLAMQDAQAELARQTANQNAQNTTNLTTASLNQQRELTNVGAENQTRQAVLQANAELNRQYLAGTQAMDLASIQGKYSQLIAANTSAAQLYDSYFSSISSTMSNTTMSPDARAQAISLQQTSLEAGLRMIDAMNTTGSTGASTPGSGTVPTAPGAPTPAPTPGTTQTPQFKVVMTSDGRRYIDSYVGTPPAGWHMSNGRLVENTANSGAAMPTSGTIKTPTSPFGH